MNETPDQIPEETIEAERMPVTSDMEWGDDLWDWEDIEELL